MTAIRIRQDRHNGRWNVTNTASVPTTFNCASFASSDEATEWLGREVQAGRMPAPDVITVVEAA